MGGVPAVCTYITPLLTGRTGTPEGAVPLVLVAFGAGALGGSALAGQALASSLGVTGPAPVGAVLAGPTLLPLIALAATIRCTPPHTAAHGTSDETVPAARTTTDAVSVRT